MKTSLLNKKTFFFFSTTTTTSISFHFQTVLCIKEMKVRLGKQIKSLANTRRRRRGNRKKQEASIKSKKRRPKIKELSSGIQELYLKMKTLLSFFHRLSPYLRTAFDDRRHKQLLLKFARLTHSPLSSFFRVGRLHYWVSGLRGGIGVDGFRGHSR